MSRPIRLEAHDSEPEALQRYDLAVALFTSRLAMSARMHTGRDGRPRITVADLQAAIDSATTDARGALGIDPRHADQNRIRLATLLTRIEHALGRAGADDELDDLAEVRDRLSKGVLW